MTNSDSSNKQPRKKAVALRYDQAKEGVPVVVGKGIGVLAERILAIAREHNIHIEENSDLVEILSKLDLHQEIPPSTYVFVAEILAFIYRTNKSYDG